jgi:hypothetical protein
MKTWFAVACVAFAILGAGTSAEAKSRWHRVADLKAGGDAKEVSVDRRCSSVLIRCTEGAVVINTIVVREGGNKTPVPVTTRINKGEDKIVEFGEKNVSGLRISDDGDGTYIVFVQ